MMKNKIKSTIKITGGFAKGLTLHSALIDHTRPSKAIIRQSLFNTLGNRIYNKSFLEVFAGYGSIGFEAISRGAREVSFIEKDINTFKILEKNKILFDEKIARCSFKDNLIIKIYNKDSFDYIDDFLHKTDIIYFDPPFMDYIYKKCFDVLNNKFLYEKIIIFEHISNLDLPTKLSNLTLHKTRKFGRSALSYYQ